jgi:hypothetical protein
MDLPTPARVYDYLLGGSHNFGADRAVHEVALRGAPDAKVVYVDIDPVAVAHSRAIVGDDPRVSVLLADIRDPEAMAPGSHLVPTHIGDVAVVTPEQRDAPAQWRPESPDQAGTFELIPAYAGIGVKRS